MVASRQKVLKGYEWVSFNIVVLKKDSINSVFDLVVELIEK